MKFFISLTFFICFSPQVFTQELAANDPEALFVKANEAYQQKRYGKFLELIRRVDELMPNHPLVVERLAKGYALNGRKTRSIQQLRKLMMLDATIDFQEDPDLKSLIGYTGYQGVINLRNFLMAEEWNDELYLTIEADSLHPESFAILNDGTIAMGSVRQKKVVRVDSSGKVYDWLEMPYSVLGMKIDPQTGMLWTATAAMPEMRDYQASDKGNSVIFQIDPATGDILQALGFDEEELYGDLVLDRQSRIWLSNSMTPYLSRDNTDTTSFMGAFVRRQYDLANTHYNLQGLTLNNDESMLYFSDYRSGLHRVNIAEDKVEPVLANSDFLPVGIDGLYYYNNTLIAIHNGVKPHKVVQYYLDEEGINVIGKRIISRGGVGPLEPTLGQIKDGYFYYLANSPWGAYDEQKRLDMNLVKPLQIRRFKLD